MGVTPAILENYLVKVLARRPREWNCCRFMAGWISRINPGLARVLAASLPRPATLSDAHIVFINHGIYNAATYRASAIKYAKGGLMGVDDPVLGDIAFSDPLDPLDGEYPSGGIVGTSGEVVFLNTMGGFMTRQDNEQGILFARAY